MGGGEGRGGGWIGLGGGMDVNEELKFLGKFKKKWGGPGGRVWWGGQDGCERRIDVFVKIFKKKIGGGGVRGGRGGGGRGQGGCERRIGVSENSKKNRGGSGGSGGGDGFGGQSGYERRIEIFVKIQKKNLGGGGRRRGGDGLGGVRVDVKELKFFGKFTQKKIGGGGSVAEGVRWGVGLVGVRVELNAMLGVGGDVGIMGDVNQE